MFAVQPAEETRIIKIKRTRDGGGDGGGGSAPARREEAETNPAAVRTRGIGENFRIDSARRALLYTIDVILFAPALDRLTTVM